MGFETDADIAIEREEYRDQLEREVPKLRADNDRLRAEVGREREATDISRQLADALREDNVRLRAERDALARRMRLLELGVWPDRDCYDQDWGFCVSWENCEYDDALEPIQNMVHDSAESCLDAAADALEAAGILPKEER